MARASLTTRIEREVAAQAGAYVAVEEAGGVITLSGRVDSAEERQAAADIAARLAPNKRIDNNLEVETALPTSVDAFNAGEPTASNLPDSVDEIAEEGQDIEPDFADEPLETTGIEDFTAPRLDDGSGDVLHEEDVVFPPTDPVVTTDRHGNTRVLGGFEPTSMTSMGVDRSAEDGRPGDEALADAVRRELREDAATTALAIAVTVRDGVVYLRGAVPALEDVDSAEDVAGRVPGVEEVVEQLAVRGQ